RRCQKRAPRFARGFRLGEEAWGGNSNSMWPLCRGSRLGAVPRETRAKNFGRFLGGESQRLARTSKCPPAARLEGKSPTGSGGTGEEEAGPVGRQTGAVVGAIQSHEVSWSSMLHV